MGHMIAHLPGLQLDGLSEWVQDGNSLRKVAFLESGTGRSRSCIVNCLDCRTVIYDEARDQLEEGIGCYMVGGENILHDRLNRLSISGGAARLSKALFPDKYRVFRDELLFAAEHQFKGQDDPRPCGVILLSHVNCGRVAQAHPGISFEEVIRETFIAGQEIADELDVLQRGANVVVVADGLIGDNLTKRYRPCGVILSQSRPSLPPGVVRDDAMKQLNP